MILQRLFSTFANGWPGKGLMILRLAVSTFLIHQSYVLSVKAISFSGFIPPVLAAGFGVLLLAGIWTPVVGGLAATLALWITIFQPGDLWAPLLASAIATGIAMLGPGSWSVDSRTYGRKRISIPNN